MLEITNRRQRSHHKDFHDFIVIRSNVTFIDVLHFYYYGETTNKISIFAQTV